MSPACITCASLRKCTHATAGSLLDGADCPLYQPAPAGTVAGRERILWDFGPYPLLKTPHVLKGEDTMSTQEEELRPALRKLAQAVGLLKPDYRAFRIKYEELVDLLNPQFPGIGQLNSAAEVNALLENVTGGGSGVVSAPVVETAPAAVVEEPAATTAPPASRKPGRPAKAAPAKAAAVVVEEPIAAPVEQVEAAVSAPPAEKRRPGLAPRRPAPTAQSAVVTVESAPAPVQMGVDLSPVLAELADLRKRVDVVGQQSDLIAGDVKRLKGNDGDLNDRMTAIIGALTFIYTHITGDEIGSIEEIDWSGEEG